LFLFERYRAPRALPSFPTRRSSDLYDDARAAAQNVLAIAPDDAGAKTLVADADAAIARRRSLPPKPAVPAAPSAPTPAATSVPRSEEHTSELQSRSDLVCRLLLEKK